MTYAFEDVTPEHRDGILRVFNYFVENDFSAYPTKPVGPEFFERFSAITKGYPFIAIKDSDEVIGFACLHMLHPADSLRRTAEISYFILPEHTRKGLATQILERFIEEAKQRGITTIMASISSLNERSLSFHRKHGFVECGHFRNVGRKFDRDFGIVWMQLDL